MIFQLVLIRFAPNVEQSQIEKFISRIQVHNERIPQVRSIEIGHHLKRDEELDNLPYGSFVSRDFPYCAMLRFDSAEALEAYVSHPDHERLSEEFQGVVEQIRVLDYIVSEDQPPIEGDE